MKNINLFFKNLSKRTLIASFIGVVFIFFVAATTLLFPFDGWKLIFLTSKKNINQSERQIANHVEVVSLNGNKPPKVTDIYIEGKSDRPPAKFLEINEGMSDSKKRKIQCVNSALKAGCPLDVACKGKMNQIIKFCGKIESETHLKCTKSAIEEKWTSLHSIIKACKKIKTEVHLECAKSTMPSWKNLRLIVDGCKKITKSEQLKCIKYAIGPKGWQDIRHITGECAKIKSPSHVECAIPHIKQGASAWPNLGEILKGCEGVSSW